jgi:outer membrane lipoprotein-sorting protein
LITMRTLILGMLVFSVTVVGQQTPGVHEILKKVEKLYSSLEEYDFVLETTSVRTDASGKREKPEKGTRRYSRKGVKVSEIDRDEHGSLEYQIVSDGHYHWAYYPEIKRYTRRRSWSNSTGGMASDEFGDRTMDELVLFSFIDSPRLLRSESVLVNGRSMNCYVIRSRYDAYLYYDYWIDHDRFVVVREASFQRMVRLLSPKPGFVELGTLTFNTVWRTINLTGPVPDSLFTFTPPPDAKLVDEYDRK